MNWEALTAISTAFTSLIILSTVLFAARQVKAANDQSKAMSAQLEHLRRATQLQGMLAIFDEIMAPDLMDSYRFIMTDFEMKMREEAFRAEALQRTPDLTAHKELPLMRHFERIGTLVKNDLIDVDVVLDFMGLFILDIWRHLEPIVVEQRRLQKQQSLWENFEYLGRKSAVRVARTRGPSSNA